jgi:uncharacterized membrane protein
MNIKRIIKHLSFSHTYLRNTFPRVAFDNIENAIAEVERKHAGQIRFAVETALEIKPLFANLSARERAIEVFSQLRIWDTEQNNGVLVYLLLADRKVEIVADRGVHNKLGQNIWDVICKEMETAFRQGKFEEGICNGIRQVGSHLEHHYPQDGTKINELPDRPVIL